MGFYNYIGGPNPLADWVPRGSIFASGFGPGGPNLLGNRLNLTQEKALCSRLHWIKKLLLILLIGLCYQRCSRVLMLAEASLQPHQYSNHMNHRGFYMDKRMTGRKLSTSCHSFESEKKTTTREASYRWESSRKPKFNILNAV